MLILNKTKAIIGWRDEYGQDIFFPKQELGGKLRGGAHGCAPVFGEVPTSLHDWAGYKLPRHGTFRIEAAEASLGTQYLYSGSTCTTKHYEPTPNYQFSYIVEEEFRELKTDEMGCLEYILRVKRDYGCEADNLMPVSLGWHPYFATHGNDFVVWVNSRPQIRETDTTDPAIVFEFFGASNIVVLETKKHTFQFEFFGASNVVVWSDDKTRYICIEAVSGTDAPHLLMPGKLTSIGIRVRRLR